MTNSTIIEVIFGGAWRNEIEATQKLRHSFALADRHINEMQQSKHP